MIKTRKDGTKYYYYYKKKVGRHKKTGKKHTPRKRGREWQETWDFKIVKCTFNKQDEFIGIFHDLTEVEAAKKILETENNSSSGRIQCIFLIYRIPSGFGSTYVSSFACRRCFFSISSMSSKLDFRLFSVIFFSRSS